MSFKEITNMCMGTMMIHSTPEQIITFAAHQGYLKCIDELKKEENIQYEPLVQTVLKNLIKKLEDKFNEKEEET